MKRARTLAVTALSAAVLAGGVSLATATSASADPISGGVSQEESGAPADSGSTGGIDDPDELSEEQIDNARTIIGVGKGADLSEEAQTIAVMTALQESSLNDLDGGDRDSAGAFQQRPSMNWGSFDEVTDTVYAAKAFYGVDSGSSNPGLTQIKNWDDIDPGDAAQEVQHSGYPDAYDKWEPLAEKLVDENQDAKSID
ncbi:hypothetical protein BI49514_02066 [Brevibacterium iodinum ATCC 49514]|uniref:Secreted protein n=1 Tax=Brevibacterium iodinum ATCC 49514 TaxID=1255616 RepID=A0A2H1JKR8_9MICO|nr:hypothetical protein BI49514_02066 [Brevibacterium iodinum ATCC 49514]SUW14032.1 Uncharacterised protein [Brevibacterium iodinum]